VLAQNLKEVVDWSNRQQTENLAGHSTQDRCKRYNVNSVSL